MFDFSPKLDADLIWNAYTTQYPPVCKTRLITMRHRLDAFIQWLAGRGVSRAGQISLELQNEYASRIISEIGNTQQDHINSLRRILSCSDITVFEKIHARRHKSVSHDIFDEKEIALLLKNTDGWIRDIFVTGLYSGLRKKDICLLEKSQIDMDRWIIKLRTHKTKTLIEIPVLPPLRTYLTAAIAKSANEYVFPELAAWYKRDPSSISFYFCKFLAKSGIINVRKPDQTRKYKVNLKGIHSLRHTFAYMCGKTNLPIGLLQATLGHASPKMTELYMRHATEQDRQRCMEKIKSVFQEVEK